MCSSLCVWQRRQSGEGGVVSGADQGAAVVVRCRVVCGGMEGGLPGGVTGRAMQVEVIVT